MFRKDGEYDVASWSEIPLFTDHDLLSWVHYLLKKASVLQNQFKKWNRMEGLKNSSKCTADKSVRNPCWSDKMIILEDVDVAIKNNAERLWVPFKVNT